MSTLRRLLPWLVLGAFGVFAWWAMHRPVPVAAWLEAEAPARAGAAHPFPVRLRIVERPPGVPQGPLMVSVHLHGRTLLGGWDYVDQAGSQPMITGVWLHFDVPVPAEPELYKAYLLVFLSPSGEWDDRVYYMRSAILRVHPAELSPMTAMQPLKVFDRGPTGPVVRADVTPARLAIGFGWLACALLWWRGARRGHSVLRIMAALAVAASLWQLLDLESLLAGEARTFAVMHRWYALRYGFQEIITLGVVVGAVALMLAAWQRLHSGSLRLAVLGLGLYAAVTVAGLVSLHALDKALALSVASIPLFQIVQLAALSAALIGGILLARPD